MGVVYRSFGNKHDCAAHGNLDVMKIWCVQWSISKIVSKAIKHHDH